MERKGGREANKKGGVEKVRGKRREEEGRKGGG